MNFGSIHAQEYQRRRQKRLNRRRLRFQHQLEQQKEAERERARIQTRLEQFYLLFNPEQRIQAEMILTTFQINTLLTESTINMLERQFNTYIDNADYINMNSMIQSLLQGIEITPRMEHMIHESFNIYPYGNYFRQEVNRILSNRIFVDYVSPQMEMEIQETANVFTKNVEKNEKAIGENYGCCTICLDDVIGDTLFKCINCDGTFHESCIEMWGKNKSCPNCRN